VKNKMTAPPYEQQEKKSKPTCYTCHAEVIFDKNKLSPRGIQIPLDPVTKEPHKCKTTEQKEDEKEKELQEQQQQQQQATVKQTELSRQNEEKLKKNGNAATNVELKIDGKKVQDTVKAEYVDHTLARPSEVKIFYNENAELVESAYMHFQIDKKFAWSRAQYQVAYSPTATSGVIHAIAFYYELAK